MPSRLRVPQVVIKETTKTKAAKKGSHRGGKMSDPNDPLVRFIEVQKSYDGESLVVKNLMVNSQ